MKIGKMKYRGTIMCDIDGVLADWENPMCDAFGYVNRHMYSPYDRYPDVPRDLIEEYISNPHNYKDLAPIFGGILFCRQAKQRGWYIMLCTARPHTPELETITTQWLKSFNVPYDLLWFSTGKQSAVRLFDMDNTDKPVRIVVDDSVSVLQSMPDKYCVAWQQEWNMNYYPSMKYDPSAMKIILHQSQDDFYPVGVWDNVGKR